MLPREAEGTIMPIHDWTCVGAGIFHHFHQRWIGAVTDVLNQHLLPAEYYALAEQQGAGFEPDVTAETDLEFYRRKQNVVAVRHASGDHLIAIVEIVSKGNKSGRKAFDDFIRKGAELLSHQVHLLILDLQPPTARSTGDRWSDLGRGRRARIRPTPRQATNAGLLRVSGRRASVHRARRCRRRSNRHATLSASRPVRRGASRGDLPDRFRFCAKRWRAILDPRSA